LSLATLLIACLSASAVLEAALDVQVKPRCEVEAHRMSEATPSQTRSAIVDYLQGSDEVRARLGSNGVRYLAANVQALHEHDPRLQRLTVVGGEIWATRTAGRDPKLVTTGHLLEIFESLTMAHDPDLPA
jgi:hypothetical protein